jgi:hypothetical protein
MERDRRRMHRIDWVKRGQPGMRLDPSPCAQKKEIVWIARQMPSGMAD